MKQLVDPHTVVGNIFEVEIHVNKKAILFISTYTTPRTNGL